jgi:hypothetical protein
MTGTEALAAEIEQAGFEPGRPDGFVSHDNTDRLIDEIVQELNSEPPSSSVP